MRPHSVLALAVLAVCSLGDRFPSQQTLKPQGDSFHLVAIRAGGGQVWPFRIRALDAQGKPTEKLLEVRGVDVLQKHQTGENRVLPPARFPRQAILPDGGVGNQFLLFRFSQPVDVATVLRFEGIQVLAYNPATEQTLGVRGRWFVGGVTSAPGNPVGTLRVVEVTAGGLAVVNPEGDGFPSGFQGDALLGRPNSVVFVADPDGDLRTPDAFPADVLIRIIVSDVRSTDGQPLEFEIVVATARDSR